MTLKTCYSQQYKNAWTQQTALQKGGTVMVLEKKFWRLNASLKTQNKLQNKEYITLFLYPMTCVFSSNWTLVCISTWNSHQQDTIFRHYCCFPFTHTHTSYYWVIQCIQMQWKTVHSMCKRSTIQYSVGLQKMESEFLSLRDITVLLHYWITHFS